MILHTNVFADALRAVGTHIQVAYELGREADWDGAPEMVDLLAGGKRKGFLESPDTLYSIGFINIQRGVHYNIVPAKSNAFCTVVSLHSTGRQNSVEFFNDVRNETGSAAIRARLGDGLKGDKELDTAGYSGMTQIMVRQYFYNRADVQGLSLPRVELSQVPDTYRRDRARFTARVKTASQFLRWRLRMLFGMKYMQMRLGDRLPKNKFVSSEEVALLFKGIKTSLTRIGISTFHYLVCMFELQPNQVLKVYYRPAKNRYFAFCLNNSWMQGLDSEVGADVHLNSSQMEADSEGGYTLYIGHQNPGSGYFLALGGHRRGVVSFREIGTSGEAARPHCEVLELGSVEGYQFE